MTVEVEVDDPFGFRPEVEAERVAVGEGPRFGRRRGAGRRDVVIDVEEAAVPVDPGRAVARGARG